MPIRTIRGSAPAVSSHFPFVYVVNNHFAISNPYDQHPNATAFAMKILMKNLMIRNAKNDEFCTAHVI